MGVSLSGDDWAYQGEVWVRRRRVGPLDNDAYFVACPETGEAVLIDAANEAPQLIAAAQGIELRAILETHGHWDHWQALAEVSREFPAAVVAAHPEDLGMFPPPPPGHHLHDGEVVEFGHRRLTVLHTPGHTPGSVCFLAPGILFSGDTLFPGGPGATRPPEGDFDTILTSIEVKLWQLPDSTLVLPGHGDPTTIGAERPHLDSWRRRGW
jgi:glyoxylase-like metal-dependent hydrolase (beta-lactamase superfamily II)